MAMAMVAGWACLPIDLLGDIVRHVPCEAGRLGVGLVCKAWRTAIAELRGPPAPPQLPWLLLSSAGGPSFFCLLSGSGAHRPSLPEDAGLARYFGSYEGGWIFLATGQNHGHTLLNFRSGLRMDVPDVISIDGRRSDVVIRAAAFSSPPDSAQFLAAAILTDRPYVAFWPLGTVSGTTSRSSDTGDVEASSKRLCLMVTRAGGHEPRCEAVFVEVAV